MSTDLLVHKKKKQYTISAKKFFIQYYAITVNIQV